MEPITTFILTDVRLYREGLEASLASRETLHVVGSGSFCQGTFDELIHLAPDTVIVGDPGLECADAIAGMLSRLPHSMFVVIGCSDSEKDVLTCAELGVRGVVPLEASLEDLVLTLECAARGEFYCSPKATAALARCIANVAQRNRAHDSATPLTSRERQIASFIEKGQSNKQIARALNIQVSTVKNHVHNILDKLNVANRVQAAVQLRQWSRAAVTLPTSAGRRYLARDSHHSA